MEKTKKSAWKIVYTVVLCIAIFLLLALTAFNICFYKSAIIGVSMQPTYNKELEEGKSAEYYEKSKIQDKAYVYRFGKGKIGDIVMVKTIENGKTKRLIKRLIAKGGDSVDIKQNPEDNNYYIYVNGKLKQEKYIKDISKMSICFTNFQNYKTSKGLDPNEAITLAANEVFVMGDNRGSSKDSSVFGPVKKSALEGVVAFSVRYNNNIFSYFWNKIF